MNQLKKYERHKRAFIVWIAIYPLITILLYLFGELLSPLPMAIRTLILTAMAVPIAFYILIPALNKAFHRWLK